MENLEKKTTDDIFMILKEMESEYNVIKKRVISDLDILDLLDRQYNKLNVEIKKRLNNVK